MKTVTLLRKIANFYPKRLQMFYDHCGLQVRPLKEETHKILLCLDFDRFVMDDARRFSPDLIITHHPFFFGNPRKIMESDPDKKALYEELLEAGFPVYSFHTNFDIAPMGMNDALAELLKLKNVRTLEGDTAARGGDLETPMGVEEFAVYAKKALGVDYGLLMAHGNKEIRSVAIVGGAGHSSWRIAKEEGYDIFISGDMPHHERREVAIASYNYLDLPHEIENAFMARMEKTLLSIDGSLEIEKIYHEKLPKVI